jgi:hypothetical protein
MRYVSMSAALALLGSLALIWGPTSAVAEKKNGKSGTITGQVILDGPIPEARKIDVTKNKAHCLKKGDLFLEEWVVNKKNKGVRYAIIWLLPDGEAKLPVQADLKKGKGEVVMDQPRCQFIPHCLAIQEGQNLTVKNSASVAHNVNPTGNPSVNPKLKNVLLGPNGSYTYKGIKAQRLPIQVSCNIHPWMKAWVAVFDHPYFAVTDADGKFTIKNVPAGKIRVVVWQESVGYLGGAEGRKGKLFVIKAGDNDLGTFKLKPD